MTSVFCFAGGMLLGVFVGMVIAIVIEEDDNLY